MAEVVRALTRPCPTVEEVLRRWAALGPSLECAPSPVTVQGVTRHGEDVLPQSVGIVVGLVLRGLAHWELQLYGRLSIPPPHVQPLRQGRLTTVYAATSAGADEAAALVSGSRTRSARMVLVHERPVRAPLVGASTWMHLHAVGSVLVFMVHSIPLGPDGVDLQYSW